MDGLESVIDTTSFKGDIDAAVAQHGTALLLHAVASSAAEKAVHNTFFMLGIDLNNKFEVDSTRDSFREMREDGARRLRRKEHFGSGLSHGFFTFIAGVLLAIAGAVAGHTSGWKLPGP